MTPKTLWWKNGIAYQIWPASYKDSNADGFGDIPGIISTLDYLKDLGIDIIWLSPHYDSPQHDMGYDISNYEEVWWKYGTMADMDKLLKEVHSRGMRLILDLVVNHTSSEHQWFKESRKSKDNDYSDWYMWRDPKYVNGERQPPNNWMSIFGGSAWEYVPERDQYYLHVFLKQQPDLNWENPVTRKAIYKTAIEFWLDKGVDGFRVDTVNLYSKNTKFPDASITSPGEKYQKPFEHILDGPRMHEWLKEQRRDVLDKYNEIVLVGELGPADDETIIKYVSSDSRELDMIFDFGMIRVGREEVDPHLTWKHELPEVKKALLKMQRLLQRPDTWTTVFAENHDQGRSLSRFATDDPKYRIKAGKLLAIMLATLSGTLFLYQGQEIGMTNIPKEWGPEDLRDVAALNYLDEMKRKHPGDDKIMRSAMAGIQRVGRDNARTPGEFQLQNIGSFNL
jgi:oligo-1,6-glucosidase